MLRRILIQSHNPNFRINFRTLKKQAFIENPFKQRIQCIENEVSNLHRSIGIIGLEINHLQQEIPETNIQKTCSGKSKDEAVNAQTTKANIQPIEAPKSDTQKSPPVDSQIKTVESTESNSQENIGKNRTVFRSFLSFTAKVTMLGLCAIFIYNRYNRPRDRIRLINFCPINIFLETKVNYADKQQTFSLDMAWALKAMAFVSDTRFREFLEKQYCFEIRYGLENLIRNYSGTFDDQKADHCAIARSVAFLWRKNKNDFEKAVEYSIINSQYAFLCAISQIIDKVEYTEKVMHPFFKYAVEKNKFDVALYIARRCKDLPVTAYDMKNIICYKQNELASITLAKCPDKKPSFYRDAILFSNYQMILILLENKVPFTGTEFTLTDSLLSMPDREGVATIVKYDLLKHCPNRYIHALRKLAKFGTLNDFKKILSEYQENQTLSSDMKSEFIRVAHKHKNHAVVKYLRE